MESQQQITPMDDLMASLGKTSLARAALAIIGFAVSVYAISGLLGVSISWQTAFGVAAGLVGMVFGLAMLFPILTLVADGFYRLAEKVTQRDLDRSGAIGDSHFNRKIELNPNEQQLLADLFGGQPLPALPQAEEGEFRELKQSE